MRPPDPRGHPAYSDISTFLHLPWVNQPIAIRAAKPDVAIVGAPFDVAVTHRPGARFDRAIRAASNLTIGAFHHLGLRIEPFNYLSGIDAGDALCPPGDIQLGHDGIREKLSELLTAPSVSAHRPRRRPLHHLSLGRDHRRLPRPPRRHRPLRCPRRRRRFELWRLAQPRHPDAPPHRRWPRRRTQLCPGRPAWLLATADVLAWMAEHRMRSHFMSEPQPLHGLRRFRRQRHVPYPRELALQ